MAVHEESVVRHEDAISQTAQTLGMTLLQTGSTTPLMIAAKSIGLG